MIKNFTISKKYQNLNPQTIKLEKINILIGPNGSGKSNLLELVSKQTEGKYYLEEYDFLKINIFSNLKINFPYEYSRIENAVKLINPIFKNFIFNVKQKTNDKIIVPSCIEIKWEDKFDNIFDFYELPKGIKRFIYLMSLLSLSNESSLILIEEPENNLHPLALHLIAEELKCCNKQIILSTHSPTLLDYFGIENLLISEFDEKGNINFKKMELNEINHWLEDYSLGELWQKGILNGRP